jgi:hypothetical protein
LCLPMSDQLCHDDVFWPDECRRVANVIVFHPLATLKSRAC